MSYRTANVGNHFVQHAYLQIFFYLSLHLCFLPTNRVFVFVFCQPLCLSFLSPVFVFFSAKMVCLCLFSSCWSCPQKKENSLLDKEKTIQCLRRLKSQLNSIQLTMKEKRLNYKPLKDPCGTCKCGEEGVLWRHVSECLLFLVQIMGSHNPRGTHRSRQQRAV